MSTTEKALTEKESLDLIAKMIHQAKNAYHDTGIAAMMWGAVVAICALVKLSEIHFNYRLPFDIFLLTLVAVIPQVIITIREKKKRKVRTYDEIYMDYVWLAFGISIFLMILIVNMIYADLRPLMADYRETLSDGRAGVKFHFMEYVSSFFLLLYGIPTFVTGTACKFRPMVWGGLLCWACCVAALFTPVKLDLLLTALAAVAAWLIPGIIMEKEYRKAKKELAAADV